MSRGIPMNEGRRLVIRGFFTEIIDKIGDEVIQERLMSKIDSQLETLGA
jgi:Fe-S cluster assembly protein SufD